MAAGNEPTIDFCTLGMFIVDEIDFLPPIPPVKDILGGAGSYSALGARLFSPPPLSKSVGWIVDCGSDFPPHLRKIINDWSTSCLLRETPKRLTTRGWNGYGENEHRAFRYLTPKLRLDHESLTPDLLRSKSFHIICSPLRCIDLVNNILARREAICNVPRSERPIFVWEPVPDVCTPEELDNYRKAITRVDLVSPNHEELAAFFGALAFTDDRVNRVAVEELCATSRSWGIGENGQGALVVRAGKEGCLVDSAAFKGWFPAYHQSGDKVVDPTGGGNGFLGGLAVALARGKSVKEAALWGSIAASFAIEQVGIPSLAQLSDGEEAWNGVRVYERLEEYRQRTEGSNTEDVSY